MFHLTEAEIMASWTVNEPIRVSVCCITYKQEKYIAQAIESFLVQKTTFPFEIVIGEDCGGDGTLAILTEFKEHYPNIIKIITSEHNVGANANLLRVFNFAKGDFIAVCEGDDYWCDVNKLQKQLDFAKKNKCSLLVHPSRVLSNGYETEIRWPCQNNFEIDYILSAKGQYAPTSSYFFKREVVKSLPVWFKDAPVGDYYIEAFASKMEGCKCINEYMSVYRLSAENSWSLNLTGNNKGTKIVKTYKKNIESLHNLIFSMQQHESAIKIKISHAEYACAQGYFFNGDYDLFREHIANSNTKEWYDLFHRMLFVFKDHLFLVKMIFFVKEELKTILKRTS
ncbi:MULTISPECIES: glycosyltransferase family 2 protein [Aeromonas]|uniref:glycosyltransferase family 2 protein n=1 Tax=Aeromonas TaxID=642 RepID=UPI000AFB883B|nr:MULTISPECIES: glycosyltransferase [Aeromonas]